MTEEPKYDPNMELARRLAEGLGPAPALPASLKDIESRCRLVSAIDGPVIAGNTPVEWIGHLGKRIAEVASIARQHLPEVGDPLVRLNIALRLWSGSLGAAKTIAMETLSGPNTPELRQSVFAHLDTIAQTDPVYKAGMEAAQAFKKLRREPFSFDGVPASSPVRNFAE